MARENRKIDLWVRRPGDKGWRYACSTRMARTCKEAVARYQPDNGSFEVRAWFAEPRA